MSEPGRTPAGEPDQVRRAFEDMPVAMVSVMGPEQQVVAANAAYRRLVGADGDLLGRPLLEVLPPVLGDEVHRVISRTRETGEPARARAWHVGLDVAGGSAPRNLHLDFVGSAVRDDDGVVVGVDLAVHDVTDEAINRLHREAEAVREQERYDEALEAVTALQDALLPVELPLLPGLDIAASYLFSHGGSAGGGDWFDAVVRPNGSVALVVGDVVGTGVQAAAVMGQLRAVLHDHLLDGEQDLTRVIGSLHRFALRNEDARAATVCVAELDPRTGALSYCTAGHPPPLVVASDGLTRFLESTGAGPLGTTPDHPVDTTVLERGELILLYSDGVLERPGVPASQATVDLARVAARAVKGGVRPGGPSVTQQVCQDELDVLTRETGYADDITLIAARRIAPVPPLRLRLPATPDAVRRVRVELAGWLVAVGARALDELTVQHAVGELVANVVEHAYADRVAPGDLELDVEMQANGSLRAEVRDSGTWDDGPDGGPTVERGRGLAMAASLVDDLGIDRSASGTTGWVRHRLTRDAQLLTGTRPEGVVARPASDEPYSAQLEGSRLTVSGSVDVISAPRLRIDLERAGRGRSRTVDLDLTDVTHLGSAGVQVLHDAEARGRLRITAASGSAAQHVLQVVNLPYARV